jgi:hypothetical protein
MSQMTLPRWADRHAHADFVGPSGDGIRERDVNADRHQQQGEQSEDTA